MEKRTLTITLPIELINRIDDQAARIYASRSEYIKQAVLVQVAIDEANSGPEAFRTINESRRRQLKEYVDVQLEAQDKQR